MNFFQNDMRSILTKNELPSSDGLGKKAHLTDILIHATCRSENCRTTRRIFFGTQVTCRF